jgi:hypothetical protein
MSRPIRLLSLACLCAAAFVAAGCASADHGPKTTAETEGLYLDVDGMKYQVQLSRYLNPSDVEDRAYLLGLPEGEEVAGDETWFAIFMRVENEGDEPAEATTEYEIHDTQDNVYRPVPLDEQSNPFAYQGGTVGPRSIIPSPDSAPGSGPIQGSLVLFKVKTQSLQYRPLELKILGRQGEATVALDV